MFIQPICHIQFVGELKVTLFWPTPDFCIKYVFLINRRYMCKEVPESLYMFKFQRYHCSRPMYTYIMFLNVSGVMNQRCTCSIFLLDSLLLYKTFYLKSDFEIDLAGQTLPDWSRPDSIRMSLNFNFWTVRQCGCVEGYGSQCQSDMCGGFQ